MRMIDTPRRRIGLAALAYPRLVRSARPDRDLSIAGDEAQILRRDERGRFRFCDARRSGSLNA